MKNYLFVMLNFLIIFINLFKGYFMKKTMLFSATFLFVASALISTNYAFSQPVDGVYFKTTIEIRDFQNNTDTVVLVVKEGATSGIDPELGEINLYGQEPSKVLEARSIQRTTVNSTFGGLNYWLEAEPSATENIDLKVDFRFDDSLKHIYQSMELSFVIKVYAQHYPVSIHLIGLEGICDSCVHLDRMQFNAEDGKYIDGTLRVAYFVMPPLHLCTFNDASENHLLWIKPWYYVSVEDNNVQRHQQLYPNPNSEFIIISEGLFGETFEIINLEGSTVKTFTVEHYPYSVDIRELSKGIYFLRSQSNIIYQFIKEDKK